MSVPLPRVLIVDPHDPVRRALADWLRLTREVEVVGEAATMEEALRLAGESRPDVVVVEPKRNDGCGMEIVRRTAGLAWHPDVIVLTSYESEEEKSAAASAGATDYVLKTIDHRAILQNIRHLH